MSKTIVRSTIKAPDFTGFVDSALIKKVQQDVVESEILPMIASGNSPVRGHGRFAAYPEPEKYPGDRKPRRPVNLSLSGKMLEKYGAFSGKSMKSLFIGIFDRASKQIRDRAEGNNLGTSGAPERRFVPIEGEAFKLSVVVALREVFAWKVRRVLLVAGFKKILGRR